MKNVVVDSSSIILLQKTALLQTFLDSYSVVLADSVYREISLFQKKGAVELAHLLMDSVKQAQQYSRIYPSMGCGERDTIELYSQGYGEFVLIDDKKAARYCKSFSIPFINSLLVPRILNAAGLLGEDKCLEKFEELRGVGYYSEKIVVRAKKISVERLEKFYP